MPKAWSWIRSLSRCGVLQGTKTRPGSQGTLKVAEPSLSVLACTWSATKADSECTSVVQVAPSLPVSTKGCSYRSSPNSCW